MKGMTWSLRPAPRDTGAGRSGIGSRTGRRVIPLPADVINREQVDSMVSRRHSSWAGCTFW